MALKSVERRVDELELNKQDTLVSGVTIKTINGNSVLGSGNLTVGGSVAWGSITGTLSDQTDLQTALNAKQNTLISGTNIKTINGNTLLGSGDLTISTGITVGTTPVTSGTDGRVFFQSGGVVQQDSNFFWDNTNKRLGVGITPLTTLHVKGSATSGFDAIRFSSQYSAVGFLGSDNSFAWFSSGAGYTGSSVSVDSSNLRFRGNTILFQNGSGTETIRILSTGFTGIGTNSPQARLDVRAQGALSTDIAFRVRNSADSANLISVAGDGTVTVPIKIRALQVDVTGQTGSGHVFCRVNDNGTLIRTSTWNYGNSTGNTWVNGTEVTSSLFTLNSTTQGFLPPRMTTTQRTAIATPAAGLIVYDTTNNKHYGYDGTAWNAFY